MGNKTRSASEIVEDAAGMLRTARLGYSDFKGDEIERRMPGLHNAVVFGRAVTNIIENLRSKVPDFDAWYKPRSAALGKIPQFRRIYSLRSEILKQGVSGISASVHIERMNTSDLLPLMAGAPAGTKGFFIGDQSGGSGFSVELPSGEVVPYYVELPDTVLVTTGTTLRIGDEDFDVAMVLDEYLSAMDEIVADARRKFGNS